MAGEVRRMRGRQMGKSVRDLSWLRALLKGNSEAEVECARGGA